MISDWLLARLEEIWQTPAGSVFLITGFLYFAGYSIYNGYISRFSGGFGTLVLNQAEFVLADLVTLFPSAIITIIKVVFRSWKKVFATVISRFVIPFVASILITWLLRSKINVVGNQLLFQINLLLWYLGVLLAWITVQPSKAWIRRFYIAFWLFLQIFGLSYSIQTMPVSVEQSTSIASPITNLWDVIFTILSILALPLIFFLIGHKIADLAIKDKLLSQVSLIVVSQPISGLGSFSKPKYSEKNQVGIGLFKSTIPINLEPEIFIAHPESPVYYITVLKNMTAFYVQQKVGHHTGKLLLVNNQIIHAVEFSENE
jgi:hypothetical protein